MHRFAYSESKPFAVFPNYNVIQLTPVFHIIFISKFYVYAFCASVIVQQMLHVNIVMQQHCRNRTGLDFGLPPVSSLESLSHGVGVYEAAVGS